MDFLTPKKNKSMKKRALSFFNLQKCSWDALPEQPSCYYEFVDIPVLFRPSSPLIDRQKIPTKVQVELRSAVTLLVRCIERGEPSRYDHPQIVKMDRLSKGFDIGATAPKTIQSPNHLSPNVEVDVATWKGKHDSGVDLETQTQESAKVAEISQFDEPSPESHQDSNYLSVTPWPTSIRASVQSSSVSQTDANASHGEQGEQDMEKLLVHEPYHQATPGVEVEEVEVFDADSATQCGTPNQRKSHPTSRLTRKQRYEDLQATTPSDSHRNSNLFNSQCPMDRPATAGELGASISEEQHNAAVIIDNNGLVHFMSAQEESQRQVDLQRAVMEKMSTGLIGRSPELNQCQSDNCNDKPRFKKQTGPSELPKAKALLRKLSMFGFGKRKAMKGRNSVGFNQILETV